MKRSALLVAALATFAVSAVPPASAQYYGGGGGYGRGYDDDDDYRPRRRNRDRDFYDDRPRRGPPGQPPGFGRDPRFGGPPFGGPPGRQAAPRGQALCSTPAGFCPSFPYPPGAPCACQTPGRPRGVIIYR